MMTPFLLHGWCVLTIIFTFSHLLEKQNHVTFFKRITLLHF